MQTVQRAKRIGSTTLIVVVGLLLAYALNNLVFHWQWPFGDSSKATIAPAGAATVTRIEPEVLDCRARINATVPLKGKKDYTNHNPVHDFVYRTDTLKLAAVGDVDTCVRDGATVQELKNGGWAVNVPAESVEFVRPRVDAVATAKSVDFEKGWVGKFTDAFPWVDDNNGLTPAAYAYAQTIIGGSSCMKAAWTPTQRAIVAAYKQQAADKHIDPNKVEVTFSGTPNFSQHDADMKDLGFNGFEFKVDAGKVECRVDPGALQTQS